MRKSNGNVDEAITKARQLIANGSAAPEAGRDLAKLEQIKAAGGLSPVKGNLYHVDIPDEAIAKMLDWDKPLSEQAESVRKALGGTFDKDATGEMIYEELSRQHQPDAPVDPPAPRKVGDTSSAVMRAHRQHQEMAE